MKTAPPEDVVRFAMASRATPYRAAFDDFLQKMLDESLEKALYSPDPDARAIHAGRAQAFQETVRLLQTRNTGRKQA